MATHSPLTCRFTDRILRMVDGVVVEDQSCSGDPALRIVTKAFLRYLPRRRGLSVLQLMGIACGVAAAVGMALSAPGRPFQLYPGRGISQRSVDSFAGTSGRAHG